LKSKKVASHGEKGQQRKKPKRSGHGKREKEKHYGKRGAKVIRVEWVQEGKDPEGGEPLRSIRARPKEKNGKTRDKKKGTCRHDRFPKKKEYPR